MSPDVERVARALCRLEYRHLASGEQLERAIDAGWPRYVEKALVAMRETRLIDAEALPQKLSEDDPACTDCDDTGRAYQTEKHCTCSQGLWRRALDAER